MLKIDSKLWKNLIQFRTLNFFSELCPSFLDIRYLKILILLSNTFPVFKINNGKLPNVLGLDTVTSTILTISQQFMRDQKVSYSTLYYFLVQGKFSLHCLPSCNEEYTSAVVSQVNSFKESTIWCDIREIYEQINNLEIEGIIKACSQSQVKRGFNVHS